MEQEPGLIKQIQMQAKKHSPELSMILGIASGVTAIIFAIRATIPAVDKKREVQRKKYKDPMTKMEVVKEVWEFYIPTISMAAASLTFFSMSMDISLERAAALATAYGISERAMKTYQEKVVETIGEKKEQEVRDKVAQERIDKKGDPGPDFLILEDGRTKCYDAYTDRYFWSDMHRIKNAVHEINAQLLDEMFVPVSEFYYAIGLNDIPATTSCGWHVDRCRKIELEYSSRLTPKGDPVLAIAFRTLPTNDFRF